VAAYLLSGLADDRKKVDDIYRINVRDNDGKMIPRDILGRCLAARRERQCAIGKQTRTSG
jgi:hypothetical protein